MRESQEKKEADEKDKNDGIKKHEIDVTKMQNPAKPTLKQDNSSSIRLPLFTYIAGVGNMVPDDSKADYTDFARLQSGVSGVSGDGATEKTPNHSTDGSKAMKVEIK